MNLILQGVTMHLNNISVKTGSRNEMVDITASVQKETSNTGVNDGICVVYVPHTTAGVTNYQ